MLAQVISAFSAEGGLVVEVFPIGLDERKRFLVFPRPVGRIEAMARLAGACGCGGVAS